MTKKKPFQDDYYFPRGFGMDKTPRIKSVRTHPIALEKIPAPHEKAADKGSGKAIYIGFIFALAMAEAKWSKERAKERLNLSMIPTTGGEHVYTPHSLRTRKITDKLCAAAPNVMARKGMGDVMRAYESGTLTSDMYDPALLAMIEAHKKSSIPSSNETQALRAKVFAYFGLPLPRAGKLKTVFFPKEEEPLAEPNPIPPHTIYEAIGQENYLHKPQAAALWDKMNLDKRRKAIEIESAKVFQAGEVAKSWKACAARLAARLPRTLQTPKTDDPAALLAAYTAPHEPALPPTPLGRRAYYLLQFAPKADT